MITAGTEVEITGGSWWAYSKGFYTLKGKKGVVVEPEFGTGGKFILVRVDGHDDVALFKEEMKVIG